MESATWCRTPAAASAGRRWRPEVWKNSSTALSSNDGEIGEVDHHLCAGHGLLDPRAGDGVDAAVGRGCDHFVAALAKNGDGLRPDQAGSADDYDLHQITSCFGAGQSNACFADAPTLSQRTALLLPAHSTARASAPAIASAITKRDAQLLPRPPERLPRRGHPFTQADVALAAVEPAIV